MTLSEKTAVAREIDNQKYREWVSTIGTAAEPAAKLAMRQANEAVMAAIAEEVEARCILECALPSDFQAAYAEHGDKLWEMSPVELRRVVKTSLTVGPSASLA